MLVNARSCSGGACSGVRLLISRDIVRLGRDASIDRMDRADVDGLNARGLDVSGLDMDDLVTTRLDPDDLVTTGLDMLVGDGLEMRDIEGDVDSVDDEDG